MTVRNALAYYNWELNSALKSPFITLSAMTVTVPL